MSVARWDGGDGEDALAAALAMLKEGSGEGGKPKVGVLVKEKPVGPLAESWAKLFLSGGNGGGGGDEAAAVEAVDVTAAVGQALALKDEVAAKNMDVAARVTSRIFKKGLVQRIEDIIDEDKTIKHDALAEEVEAIVKDPAKIDLKVRGSLARWCGWGAGRQPQINIPCKPSSLLTSKTLETRLCPPPVI